MAQTILTNGKLCIFMFATTLDGACYIPDFNYLPADHWPGPHDQRCTRSDPSWPSKGKLVLQRPNRANLQIGGWGSETGMTSWQRKDEDQKVNCFRLSLLPVRLMRSGDPWKKAKTGRHQRVTHLQGHVLDYSGNHCQRRTCIMPDLYPYHQ